MGSIVSESDDIVAVASGGAVSEICISADRIHSTSVFTGGNPLEFSVPLLFIQLVICAGTIILFYKLLKPLGQPLIVSQILGGLVLGSSGFGYLGKFREVVFPLRGFIFLDLVSSLGHIFYFFLLGVQMDMSVMKMIDKRAFGIGCCSVIMAMILTTIFPITLINIVDTETFKTLLVVGKVETFINFAMVASLLSELHLLNSEFGRIALASSMASNIFSFFLLVLIVIMTPQSDANYNIASSIYGFVVVAVVILFTVQPIILWMIKQHPVGQPLKESLVITLLLGVLVLAFYTHASGLPTYFGPFLLGITIPPGPPIGSALVERLDSIISWVFMPIFFLKIGLAVNVHTFKLINVLVLSFIIFVSALGKFLGAFMIAMYCKLPMRDAVSLGLILNSQGALELGIFKMMKGKKTIDGETFVVMCLCVMVLVAIVATIIRYLFDPSRRYVVHKRRTVMHSKFDLCVLVCIHDQEDVPSAISLLEALNPTRQSHLVVYMLHLVELLGRAYPQLIQHKLTKVRASRSCPSKHIVNSFKYFGQSNNETVAIHPFTTISPCATMHDDVCSLALEKSTSLILVAFHQKFHSNGVLSFSKHKMKMVNHHILDKAPCSVALIVERGILKAPISIATNLSSFQIVVVFIGGPDDREAMFIGARMVGHPNINLTIIRLLENENVSTDDVKERRLDNEVVVEFRKIMKNNNKVRYIEEVVNDGTRTISILRSMGNNFDLVIVGRRHSPCSALVQGLVLWNEYTELGEIGEVLASSDFLGNSMIFVVQQHTKVVDEFPENHQETVIPMDRYLDDAKELPIQANHKSFESPPFFY